MEKKCRSKKSKAFTLQIHFATRPCNLSPWLNSLGDNKLFRNDLVKFEWVSKISLSNSWENEIRQSFNYTYVEFYYPENNEDFSLLLEAFQKYSYDEEDNTNDNRNIYSEKKNSDKLIVMDDVSGLADKSNEFRKFLTVSRKFACICLYIFHIIYPTKSTWQMILSQTKKFNIFPSLIQLGNKLKIFTNNCDKETIRYIPARDL